LPGNAGVKYPTNLEGEWLMEFEKRERARSSVLKKLGLSSLVSTSQVDISASHQAHVEQQTIPARFKIDGLTVDAPAGVYHPAPDSSSELFLRNIKAMNPERIAKTLEIGAGCGAISLFIAAKWKAKVTASDISPLAIGAIKKNAEMNGMEINCITSDLFENIKEKDFDLIIFNAPLIDKEPENNIEKYSLCDPEGHIVGSFLRQAGNYLSKDGMVIVSMCSNTAYEVMDDIGLRFKIVGFELSYSGFWWAIVGAQN
jgi:release factor glutamine methyltransferase